jgi:hypothetical protein
LKNTFYILFLVLSFFSNYTKAQQVDAPSLRCVSVLLNNDIEVTWVAPNDPNNQFINYQLYASDNVGGPYIQVFTINNINTTSFVDNNFNPNLSPVYYYLITTYQLQGGGSAFSNPSDTISTMLLNVAGNNTGTANLTWNAPKTPLPPHSSNLYNIYRRYLGSANWNLIGSTAQRNFLDIVTNCTFDSIFYRVELINNLGCSSFSTVNKGFFMDLTEPSISVIDSVSVNPTTGEVTVGWTPNNTTDVEYYHIYQFNAGQSPPWMLVDSIYGQNSTFTTIPGSNANNESFTFALAAFDTCRNSSQFSLEHNTIHLKIDYEKCKLQANLEWNEYKNWANGVRFYNVLRSENGGPFISVATLTNTTLSYLDENLDELINYCYMIRATERVSNNRSRSNMVCFLSEFVPQPSFAYIKAVSVVSDNSIEIKGVVDTIAGGLKYIVEKRVDGGGFYEKVAEVPGSSIVNNEFYVLDESNVYAQNNVYFYRFTVIDSCGLEARRSNFARNIKLEVKFDWDTWNHDLKWTVYRDWDGDVVSYSIYRGVDGVFEPNPFVVLPDTVREFTDNATDFFENDGDFCYYIVANEGPGNRFNYLETSKSNVACFGQAPRIFVPNAFNPKGVNRVFKPKHSFVSSENYEFIIFDRRGVEIFKTTDKDEGWDGKIKREDDDFAPFSVYVYRINYVSTNGQELTKIGRVTLLK